MPRVCHARDKDTLSLLAWLTWSQCLLLSLNSVYPLGWDALGKFYIKLIQDNPSQSSKPHTLPAFSYFCKPAYYRAPALSTPSPVTLSKLSSAFGTV